MTVPNIQFPEPASLIIPVLTGARIFQTDDILIYYINVSIIDSLINNQIYCMKAVFNKSLLFRSIYFKKNIKQLQKQIEQYQKSGSTANSIIINKKKMQLQGIKDHLKGQLQTKSQKFISDNLMDIRLYMVHDDWKSQYIYSILNYQKVGFRRTSDLAILDKQSYILELRALNEEERWPAAKILVGLQPKIILKGVQQIYQFFKENQYFYHNIDRSSLSQQAIQDYIDKNLVPALESLFWHPTLTFQSTFHTNISSYYAGIKTYIIFPILFRNFTKISKKIVKNLILISKEKERYSKSRQNTTKCLNQLQKILNKNQYFGGEKPNHLDFYLQAIFNTKNSSKHFKKYLEAQGGQIWRWWTRMGAVTQHDSQRMTFL